MAFNRVAHVRGEFLRRSPKLIHLASFVTAFIGAHAICLLVFRSQAAHVSYPFLILAPLFAVAGCGWRAAAEHRTTRAPWILLGAGLLLWTGGISLSAWEELFRRIPISVAWFSDFCYFLYGVPLLLAISSVSNEQRIPFFIWMDGIQAALTAYLTYITLFSVAPFSHTALEPISVLVLLLTYNVENVVLAAAATLRLFVQPRGRSRRFYEILFGYLWIYAAMAAVYNSWTAASKGYALMDVVVDVPFLLLAAACMLPPAEEESAHASGARRPLAVVVENGGPIFYTVALLLLSISVMRQHFYVGTVGIFTALVVYAIRTTMLQSRLVRAQQDLSEARDRVEKMALTDALTHAANRRCFDQSLILEWDRAARHPFSLSLLLVDIDHFKQLNDRYGHPAGDKCLVAVAAALQSALPRRGDLLARYGGEEFATILPATDEHGARLVAGKMQAAVDALQIRNETSTGSCVTVSIGVAVFESPGTGAADQIVEAADQALYRAKALGRNRIESIGQRDFVKTAAT